MNLTEKLNNAKTIINEADAIFITESKKYSSFVFTSNVDSQFQKSGFSENQIMECHGSIHYLQCADDCQSKILSAEDTAVEIDQKFQAIDPLPSCSYCNRIARPNILMFGDFSWSYSHADRQRDRLKSWLVMLRDKGAKLAIIEMGAGTAVPTVRNSSEQVAKEFDTPLIRINPRESQGAIIGLELGAVEALTYIL